MPQKMLSELRKGDKGKIIKIGGKGPVHRRLLDMGLVAGSEVEMQRVAPLGNPLVIKVKG